MDSYNNHKRRNLIVIIIVCLLLAIPFSRFIRKQLYFRKYPLRSAIEWAKRDSTRVADSLNGIMADKRNFETVLTDSLMSIGEQNNNVSHTGSRYHIIIGSFANPVNAKIAEKQYIDQGYSTKIIETINSKGKKVIIVSVKSFAEYDEAESYLKELQGNVNPDAWLFKDN